MVFLAGAARGWIARKCRLPLRCRVKTQRIRRRTVSPGVVAEFRVENLRLMAAGLLGIGRTTLYRKLKEYQMAV